MRDYYLISTGAYLCQSELPVFICNNLPIGALQNNMRKRQWSFVVIIYNLSCEDNTARRILRKTPEGEQQRKHNKPALLWSEKIIERIIDLSHLANLRLSFSTIIRGVENNAIKLQFMLTEYFLNLSHIKFYSMHLNSNEITLIYNGKSDKDKKTLAYALSLNKKINRQDLACVRVSDTLFEFMMDRVKQAGKSVFNKADPFYQKHMKGKELSNSEYLEYLKRNPDLMFAPVAMYNGKVVICHTPTDVLKVLG